MKILCDFDGIILKCKVIESLGFQGGEYAKVVEYQDKERTVIKRGNIWIPKPGREKIKPFSRYQGMKINKTSPKGYKIK